MMSAFMAGRYLLDLDEPMEEPPTLNVTGYSWVRTGTYYKNVQTFMWKDILELLFTFTSMKILIRYLRVYVVQIFIKI